METNETKWLGKVDISADLAKVAEGTLHSEATLGILRSEHEHEIHSLSTTAHALGDHVFVLYRSKSLFLCVLVSNREPGARKFESHTRT